jgi:hypothetical protein
LRAQKSQKRSHYDCRTSEDLVSHQGWHPGRRFHDFYRHRQMERGYRFTFGKIAAIVLGLVIVAVGLALIPLPGPGAIIASSGWP